MRIVLVLLCLLAATSALAVPVDPDAADGVAAWSGTSVLCTSGEVYFFVVPEQRWVLDYDGAINPPVPVNEIADWSVNTFTTISGEHWAFYYSGGWVTMPLPPCAGPVDTQNQNMGDLKSLFR